MSWLIFDVTTATMADWLALGDVLGIAGHPKARQIREALATLPALDAMVACRKLLRGSVPRGRRDRKRRKLNLRARRLRSGR